MEKIENIIEDEIVKFVNESSYNKTIIFRSVTEFDEYKVIEDHFETTPTFGSMKRGRREYYLKNNIPVTNNERFLLIDKMLETSPKDKETTNTQFEIEGAYRYVRNPN